MRNFRRGEKASTAPQALSPEETATLLYVIEEEKLAGDIYEAFVALYGTSIFVNIAESEDSHHAAVLVQADRLGVDTSFLPTEPGVYADPDLQALYDSLLAMGSVSYEAALEVGVLIETEDLISLQLAQDETDDPLLDRTYATLEDGSENHLAAFLGAQDAWA